MQHVEAVMVDGPQQAEELQFVLRIDIEKEHCSAQQLASHTKVRSSC